MACLVAAQRWLRSSVQDTAALQCDGRIMYFTYAKRLILVPSKVVSAKISEEILRTIKSSPSHVRKANCCMVWCVGIYWCYNWISVIGCSTDSPIYIVALFSCMHDGCGVLKKDEHVLTWYYASSWCCCSSAVRHAMWWCSPVLINDDELMADVGKISINGASFACTEADVLILDELG